MFRITCLVDDSRLAKVLHLLDGQVHDLEQVPVRNVKLRGGKPASTIPDGASPLNALTKLVEGMRKGGRIHTSALRATVEKHGGASASTSYFTRQLIAAKKLKATKERGIYVKV